MDWKMAEARQKLTEVVEAARREPQRIFKRDRLVAAVVDARSFEEFSRWRAETLRPTIAEAFAQLRALGESGVPTVRRHDRKNAFAP